MSTNDLPQTKIAVIGYGSQGRAHALNLRESGFDVVVGLRPGGPTEVKAQADGFTVKAPADAVRDADLVAVLTPDMVQKKLYDDVLAPNMKQGAVLLFAHGLNVHFDMIRPREDLDVVLVAPRARARWCAASTRSAVACPASGRSTRTRAARPPSTHWPMRRPRRCTRQPDPDHLQGRDRDRPVRRAGGAVRRRLGAGAGRFRDPGGSGLPAGDRLLRSAARTEADRRPVLRRWHLAHAGIHL